MLPRRPLTLATLKRMEWAVMDDYWCKYACPACGGLEPTHTPGCELAAEIARLEAPGAMPPVQPGDVVFDMDFGTLQEIRSERGAQDWSDSEVLGSRIGVLYRPLWRRTPKEPA